MLFIYFMSLINPSDTIYDLWGGGGEDVDKYGDYVCLYYYILL